MKLTDQDRRAIVGAAQRCLTDGETGMSAGDCNRTGWHVGAAVADAVEALPDPIPAALAEHRLEWASWLEGWEGAAGVEPPTIAAVVKWLRAESLPFGVAAGDGS